MGLGYSRELQAKDDVSVRRRQQQPNKKSKRAAVSSDTDWKQLATGKKKRRLVKGVKKEEEEESTVKKEVEIEDDLHNTPVPFEQASSALSPNPADEKPAALGRGNVCNENKLLSEGTEQSGSTREEDKMYEKLQGYYGKHGHCELFWAVDRFAVIFEYLH
jgi:hypothetical protein